MKKITNKIGSYLWMFVAGICMLFLQTGCNEDDIPFIGLDNEVLALSSEMSKNLVDVKANVDWKASSDAEWCKILKGDGDHKGQFEILVEKNMTPEERVATIVVAGKEASATLMVKQAPGNFTMGVSTETVAFSKQADSYKVSVVSNFDWKVVSSNDWCKVSVASGSLSGDFSISVSENNTGSERKAIVSVITEVSGEAHIKNITVTQASTENYLVLPITEFMVSKEASELDVAYVAGGTMTSIQASDNVSWLSCSVEDDKIVVTIDENDSGEEREAEIAVTAVNVGAEPIIRKVKIVQTASDFYFVVPVENLLVEKKQDVYTVDYELMGDGVTVKCTSDCNWLHPENFQDEKQVKITVDQNVSNKEREGKIILTTENNPGEPVVKVINIKQKASDFHFVVSIEEMMVGKDKKSYEIGYELLGDSINVKVTTDCEWLVEPTVNLKENKVLFTVEENTTENMREGKIILTTENNPGEPVVKTIVIKQLNVNNILETLVDEVAIAPQGETVKLPFYANTQVEVRSGAEWLTAKLVNSDIEVSASENLTQAARETYATVTVTSDKGEKISKTIKVTQLSLDAAFAFDKKNYELTYEEYVSYAQLHTYGKWAIVDGDQLPGWLMLEGTTGEGDATVTIKVKKNYYSVERSFEIKFQNTDLKKETILRITQQGNPNGVDNFSFLGKGYQATGKFADVFSVKEAVLDQKKLNNSGLVLEINDDEQQVTKSVIAKDLNTYKSEVSKMLGVDKAVNGFSASILDNFSNKALEDAEYSFATYRFMVKKGVLKLDEQIEATELQKYLSAQFLNDINALSAEALVEKYGTHIIAGFAMGGALDYSVAFKEFDPQFDMENALIAGFENYSKGVDDHGSFDLFSQLKKKPGFEERLVKHGGDGNFSYRAYSMVEFNKWMTSLTNEDFRTIVDYEGVRLIMLSDLIKDASKKQEVQAYIESLII